jgi:ubiquinone/menaquinone biosynthesis C-methylase UbiE
LNEVLTEAAFSKQSGVFDALYSGNTIVRYKRERVRRHVLSFLPPDSHILELNCGTGEDATFFAGMGHRVHATDLSGGMLEQLQKKVSAKGLDDQITSELCSFTALDTLKETGPYDLIFSNFAGLNCTGDLAKVVASFPPLLKPGGMVTLVLLPPFCLWETLLVLKGKVRTAFRRFFSNRGRNARVEGFPFKCWYYWPSVVHKALGPSFETLDLEGLCTLVPPSYIEGFAEKRPELYRYLKALEEKRRRLWPWKYIGDYYILSLRKLS